MRGFPHIAARENVSLSVPPQSTWAAADLRQKFSDFYVGGIGEKILLKASTITE